jgi:hypothetical protein
MNTDRAVFLSYVGTESALDSSARAVFMDSGSGRVAAVPE